MSDHARRGPTTIVRSAADVGRLHDLLLVALNALDDGSLDLPTEMRHNAHGMVNLCCWLLGHPDGASVEEVLTGLPLILTDAGLPRPEGTRIRWRKR